MTYLPDGRLRSFDTSFERRCFDDERAAARGTWRVGGPGRDLLDCGPGRRDRVVAGRGDHPRNCERRL